MFNNNKIHFYLIPLFIFLLSSCKSLPGADARKFPPDPKKRVEKNMEDGKSFRLDTMMKGNQSNGTNYEFASSNELWRASLDTIDFIPLASVNYSGGIIVSDWYSTEQSSNESIKISIRFLTNEIRADALDIKVFNKTCKTNNECMIKETNSNLIVELQKEILKKATLYKKNSDEKKKKPYSYPGIEN